MGFLEPAMPYLLPALLALIALLIVWIASKLKIHGLTFEGVMQILLMFLQVEVNPKGVYASLPERSVAVADIEKPTSVEKYKMAEQLVKMATPKIYEKITKKPDRLQKVFNSVGWLVNSVGKMKNLKR